MEDEVYNIQCNRIRENNAVVLELFEKGMIARGLSKRTIHRHMSNVDSYINGFLILYDIHPMEDGLHMLSEYLGDFFYSQGSFVNARHDQNRSLKYQKVLLMYA